MDAPEWIQMSAEIFCLLLHRNVFSQIERNFMQKGNDSKHTVNPTKKFIKKSEKM